MMHQFSVLVVYLHSPAFIAAVPRQNTFTVTACAANGERRPSLDQLRNQRRRNQLRAKEEQLREEEKLRNEEEEQLREARLLALRQNPQSVERGIAWEESEVGQTVLQGNVGVLSTQAINRLMAHVEFGSERSWMPVNKYVSSTLTGCTV
ncbi:hypothetical protein GUITHDRAFT_100010 [Guillardia theta CCMP2712]|uniref:IBB domain-containing protein n=1 Tax=Guillardia theta (strain CCMP2712) TaxID=905079 RepID=L1K2D1_GUITC|nr:hypothetical protein GUITHDRAFT_100010 [Guillardia theta CCMP2712]EKX54533.1 hypothetical protein GUITHDRAFT_100010 [Guillardia theta CCMP2712]|eukprot:XP_005841513.1 hypothetical protein GUITHDRAFT_100010 [Guillardia theta CCMP2712]